MAWKIISIISWASYRLSKLFCHFRLLSCQPRTFNTIDFTNKCIDSELRMGMSEINTWVTIRRYDKLDEENTELLTSLERLTLTPGSMSDEIKSSIFKFIGTEDDGSRVLKIRRHDNNLIPISTLTNGSSREMPFIIDVVCVHQFCPVERRRVLPNYVDALNTKFSNLEQRVKLAESALPDLTNGHVNAVEDIASQLANCLDFLDRRLDELSPPAWKPQLESAI